MFERIISFSLNNRALVLFATLAVTLFGLHAAATLPIDAVPDITTNQVQINTLAPGLSPFETEKQITYPVEVAMSGLPGLVEVRSLSKYGLSQVTVVFDDRVDIYFARQLVSERLLGARERLPDTAQTPQLAPVSTGLGEIYQYIVRDRGQPRGATVDELINLRTTQDWIIRPQLLQVPGVAEVNVFGGYVKEYQVRLDPEKLLRYHLTVRQVYDALARNNANAGGAFIEHAGAQYIVRGVGLVRGLSDIRNVVLAAERGQPVRVGDVAEVVVGPGIRQGGATQNGRGEVVLGIAMLLKGENSRTVVNRVKERLEHIKPSLPEGTEIVPVYDRSELIDRTVSTVRRNLAEGGFLVVAVLLLLLGSWRGALIAASAIPLSMLIAFIGMHQFGISANLMSLGAIDFGLIVDGAVIIVENTVRRLSERARELGRRLSPAERLETVRQASLEVRTATAYGETIISVVYLPILTLAGTEGKMFRPMALTVLLALGASFVLTLTVVPALCSLLLGGQPSEREPWLMERARALYLPALRGALRLRPLIVGTALALIAFAAVLFPRLGSEFIPRLDEGAINLRPARLPGISLPESLRIDTEIERVLLSMPEVRSVTARTGTPEVATDPMGPHEGDVFVELRPPSEWKSARTREALIKVMQTRLADIPGVAIEFSQPIEDRFNELISGVRADVAVKVFGDDMALLRQKGAEVEAILRKVPGAQDLRVEQVAGQPYLQIEIDRDAIARYGINVADVQEVIEAAVGGKEASRVLEGDRSIPLVLRFRADARGDGESIGRILLTGAAGEQLPLSQLAHLHFEDGPVQISREAAQRRIVVQCNIRGRDLGGFIADAQRRVAKALLLPPGYHVEWGGQFENLERAQARLLIVVPATMLLVLILLFATFGSFPQALLMFTGVPLAISGGVFALWLRGMPFSISAGVGFIALMGVAVLNGLVMVSHFNRLREAGKSLHNAVVEGAGIRLRPVLMTGLVASLGFLPMALAQGGGAEVQRPLATVVVGGLVTSTALTLFVLPALFAWLERDGAGVVSEAS